MKFKNPSLIFVRTDGRASPKQYAPSTFKVGAYKYYFQFMENKISRSLVTSNFLENFETAWLFPDFFFSFFLNFPDSKWNFMTFPWSGFFLIFQIFFLTVAALFFNVAHVSICNNCDPRTTIGTNLAECHYVMIHTNALWFWTRRGPYVLSI